MEPKEKGGEVTLQQTERPCVVVNIGYGETCTINNIKMIMKGAQQQSEGDNITPQH